MEDLLKSLRGPVVDRPDLADQLEEDIRTGTIKWESLQPNQGMSNMTLQPIISLLKINRKHSGCSYTEQRVGLD